MTVQPLAHTVGTWGYWKDGRHRVWGHHGRMVDRVRGHQGEDGRHGMKGYQGEDGTHGVRDPKEDGRHGVKGHHREDGRHGVRGHHRRMADTG